MEAGVYRIRMISMISMEVSFGDHSSLSYERAVVEISKPKLGYSRHAYATSQLGRDGAMQNEPANTG